MLQLKDLGQWQQPWPYQPYQPQYPTQPRQVNIQPLLTLGLPIAGFIFLPKIIGTICNLGGCLVIGQYLSKILAGQT